MGYGIDNTKVFVFVYSSYLCTIIHSFECERKTIRWLTTEEMYYSLIFRYAKQSETIHNELTYFIVWAKLLEQIRESYEI